MGKRVNTAKWYPKQNRWQIKVQKDGERRTFTSSTPGRTGQREANAKADAWLDEGIIGFKRVEELWEKYLERCKSTTSLSNFKSVQSIGQNYILPQIGHLKIEKVTESKLQDILDLAYKQGSLNPLNRQLKPTELPLSRKSLLNIRATMMAFFKWCRIQRVTNLFPESLSIPQGARYKEKRVLQPEALALLFSCDTTLFRGERVFDRYIYAYRFQVSCGLRPGELMGLTVGDISPTTRELQIKRSINIWGEETLGKNQNAIRGFVLPPQAWEAYQAQMDYLRTLGSIHLSTPLFQIENQHSYYRHWTRYLKSNGLQPISPYELRHTFVSVAKYLPEGTVKVLVGHSRSMDTFGQYGHELSDDAWQTAQAVGELFSSLIKK